MNLTIRDILEYLTSPVGPFENTVDKLEYGNLDSTVTAVGVTFLATQDVVLRAKDLGINLIITHEGIFYSHWDQRENLKSDPVYRQKCQVIEESQIAIFRYHDYVHRHLPDRITRGLLHSLGWQQYEVKNLPEASILEIPGTTIKEMILDIKKQLGIQFIRYMGDPLMPCKRIGLLVGYRGGGEQVIPLFEEENLDLVIYGEGPEWETPEYIRDAIRQGRKKALIVLGHAESEIPGMEWVAKKLQGKFPGLTVCFLPQQPIFKIF